MMGSKISVASSSSSSGPVEVRQKQQEEDDSDENVVFFPSSISKQRRTLASDSDSSSNLETKNDVKFEGVQSESGHKAQIRKKIKIRSCLDSSDEENTDVNIKTLKFIRIKKLQQMSKNIQVKKGLYVSSEEENEEELPEQVLKSIETVNEDSNLEDFVVDDVVEMENQTDDEDEAKSTDSEETKFSSSESDGMSSEDSDEDYTFQSEEEEEEDSAALTDESDNEYSRSWRKKMKRKKGKGEITMADYGGNRKSSRVKKTTKYRKEETSHESDIASDFDSKETVKTAADEEDIATIETGQGGGHC